MKRIILFLLPKCFDAITLFSKVYARDESDLQLMAHENVHAEQQRKNPVGFYVGYLFNKTLRKHYEAEAYAMSVQYGMTMHYARLALANNYKLNITLEEAEKLIESYL